MEQAHQFEELLNRSGINPSDVERIDRMNVWQGFIKNDDGEIEKTDLLGMQIKPRQEEVNLEELLVHRAEPLKLYPSKRIRPTRDGNTMLVGGDMQIPFHDERAMDLFQTLNAELRPDELSLVGDNLDLQSMSRFSQRPEWVGTVQGALDYFHRYLGQLAVNNPGVKINVIHGNHEQRFDNYVRNNAAEVLGIKRANAQHELAVLSLRYLMRYDDLGINVVDGYPNGVHWPEGQESLKLIHGTETKKGGSNAARYLATEHESTIYGHTHRQELAYRTYARRLGGVTIAAASPGALCLTDGSVPGFHSTIDSEGQVVRKAEDWQQGILYLHRDDENWDIEPALITDRGVHVDGKRFNV